MKFVLHLDSNKFLVCASCGAEDFNLMPDKKLSADEQYKFFLFYECPNCAGAGFWTHHETVDKKRQIGKALARCKMPEQLKSSAAEFKQQSY